MNYVTIMRPFKLINLFLSHDNISIHANAFLCRGIIVSSVSNLYLDSKYKITKKIQSKIDVYTTPITTPRSKLD